MSWSHKVCIRVFHFRGVSKTMKPEMVHGGGATYSQRWVIPLEPCPWLMVHVSAVYMYSYHFSGYDSESALVSQSSLDMGGLITFNSSLTRFILMLDIWLCQVRMHTYTLHVINFCHLVCSECMSFCLI